MSARVGSVAKCRYRHSTGFTLIEVMVALLVVALAVSALLVRMASYVDNTAYLRDKTIAHWVALNQLELQRLTTQNSNRVLTNEESGDEEMAGRRWYWRIKPEKTAADGFIKVNVQVFTKEADTDPVVSLVGYLDQFHRR